MLKVFAGCGDLVGILVAQGPYFDPFNLDQGAQMARTAIAQPDNAHAYGWQFGCGVAGHVEALAMGLGVGLVGLQRVGGATPFIRGLVILSYIGL